MKNLALLTQVLERDHLFVLEDWIDFVARPISALYIIVGPDPMIAEDLAALCRARGMALRITDNADAGELKENETGYLHRQFAACSEDLAILTRLDTLPFRRGHDGWLEALLDRMQQDGAFFLTGSTLPFRADRPTATPQVLRTGRVSNNFLVIAPARWLAVQNGRAGDQFGRFETEGRIEDHCERTGEFGLRRLNERDWRVFHTQIWDARLREARAAFHAGKGLEPFMRGYEDDLYHPWERHYMHPGPGGIDWYRVYLGGIGRDPVRESGRLGRRLLARLLG